MIQSKFALAAQEKTDEQILQALSYPNNCYDRDVANQNEAILRIWKKVFGEKEVTEVPVVSEVVSEKAKRGRKAKVEEETAETD